MAPRARRNGNNGFLYRSYHFVDKDPVIDKLRTLVQDNGMTKHSDLAALSGCSPSTYKNMFEGDTRMPRHSTIAATAAALGYEVAFEKKKEINFTRELKKAHEELAEHRAKIERAKKREAGRTGR